MGDCIAAHNVIVDSYQECNADVQWLKNKVTDLEDRSRRNNLKFRGIPESISPPELTPYLLQLLKTLLPMENTQDLIIDRAHHIAKPNTLPDMVPRDVLARIHFFNLKDRAMAAARKVRKLPDPFFHISIYADLKAVTLARHRQFAPITEVNGKENSLQLAIPSHTSGHPPRAKSHPPLTDGGEKTSPAMEYTCTLSKCECSLQSSSFLNKRQEPNSRSKLILTSSQEPLLCKVYPVPWLSLSYRIPLHTSSLYTMFFFFLWDLSLSYWSYCIFFLNLLHIVLLIVHHFTSNVNYYWLSQNINVLILNCDTSFRPCTLLQPSHNTGLIHLF